MLDRPRIPTARARLTLLATLALLGAIVPAAAGPAQDTAAVAPTPEASLPQAWMGVWLEDAVDGGVEIVAIVPGSPAALAELRPGDVILRANRAEIPVQGALRKVLAALAPGDTLSLQVLRSGRPVEATVNVVARSSRPELAGVPRPATPPSPTLPAAPRLVWSFNEGGLRRTGLEVADITPALRQFYGAPGDAGVLVTRAESQKPAALAGIRVGDILVRLGDRSLTSTDQVNAQLATWNERQPLTAVVIRDAQERTVRLEGRNDAGAEESDESRREGVQRELLERRLKREMERLQQRIEEIRQELRKLEGEQGAR